MKLYDYERINYENIKMDLLEGIFNDMKNNLYKKKFLNENSDISQLISKTFDDFENVYERPIERLMFLVIIVIISEGLKFSNLEFYYAEIGKILYSNECLENLLVDIPSREVEIFQADLEIIGLL